MPFGFDDSFECPKGSVAPANPWAEPIKVVDLPLPDYANDENLKKSFGLELGKGSKPFQAALAISDGNAAKALWISNNWITDPLVIATRDVYIESVKSVAKPLDKEQLLARLLEFSDEETIEAKERLQALNLYAEIAGFKGKAAETAANNNITNNTFNKITKVVLVSPKQNQSDNNINTQSKMQNVEIPSIPLKLVGGVSR